MKNKRWCRLSILGAAIAGIIAVACGASSGSGSTTAPVTTPAPVAPAAGTAPEALAQPVLGPGPIVEPDADYRSKVTGANIRTAGWITDFSRHAVAFDEILSRGVPRDGIPPLDDPKFTSIDDADLWLEDLQPVIAFKINNEARAYPLGILTWHEVVNDVVGGVQLQSLSVCSATRRWCSTARWKAGCSTSAFLATCGTAT